MGFTKRLPVTSIFKCNIISCFNALYPLTNAVEEISKWIGALFHAQFSKKT